MREVGGFQYSHQREGKSLSNQNTKVVTRLLWIRDKQGLLVPRKVTRADTTWTGIQSSGPKALMQREKEGDSVCVKSEICLNSTLSGSV